MNKIDEKLKIYKNSKTETAKQLTYKLLDKKSSLYMQK